ncbi:MAG: hypothetical protein L0Z50_42950 [Verrucomicrobiales bacterium]|nr:hypothetical protein [Verrucomicrobiales bacterium]
MPALQDEAQLTSGGPLHMEILFTFILLIGVLLIPLVLMARLILPKRFGEHLLAQLTRDVILGIWHFVFGPPRTRITKDKKGRHGPSGRK